MADELKDQRIPIMMTPSEVKGVEDWMFSNRIRSRGEAIRKLVVMGFEMQFWKDRAKTGDELIHNMINGKDYNDSFQKYNEANNKYIDFADSRSEGIVLDARYEADRLEKRLETENLSDENRDIIRSHIDGLRSIKRDKDL